MRSLVELLLILTLVSGLAFFIRPAERVAEPPPQLPRATVVDGFSLKLEPGEEGLLVTLHNAGPDRIVPASTCQTMGWAASLVVRCRTANGSRLVRPSLVDTCHVHGHGPFAIKSGQALTCTVPWETVGDAREVSVVLSAQGPPVAYEPFADEMVPVAGLAWTGNLGSNWLTLP